MTSDFLANLEADGLVDISIKLTEFGFAAGARNAILHAIRKEPNNARAHVALAEYLLRHDWYLPGFREYEWSAFLDPGAREFPDPHSPLWTGYRLPESGRLWVIADQGYGDTIMFSRYLRWAATLCDEILFICPPEIVRLFQDTLPDARVFSAWHDKPPHCSHVRLSSLPLLHATASPEHLPPPLTLKLPHHESPGLKPGRLKIGLAWAGKEDIAEQRARSIPIKDLRHALDIKPINDGCQFVCLQKDAPESDISGDWGDTAALISKLDLVITSDTAIAHLAGTLAVPTFVLLQTPADWRYGIERDHNPWYPSQKLFRQEIRGNWRGPIHAVARVVENML